MEMNPVVNFEDRLEHRVERFQDRVVFKTAWDVKGVDTNHSAWLR